MKKTYETPRATLTAFVASETLASIIDFDDLITLKGGLADPTSPSVNDIDLKTE